MPTFEHETIIPAPLERVWAFHQDAKRALPRLSPVEAGVVIESVEPDPPRLGTRVTVLASVPLRGKMRWIARYVEFVEPRPVVFGMEARFVDEQEVGPFKRWRHAHEFEAIDDNATRLRDFITYDVGFGPIGWILDRLIVRRQLSRMFAHRRTVLLEVFSSPDAPPIRR